MIAYKLCRIDSKGNLKPMFVHTVDGGFELVMPIGEILEAMPGERIDETHVKSRLGALSFRPGWHLTLIPDTTWIGKRDKETGKLVRRANTVWVECEIFGEEIEVKARNGLRTVPEGWYRFKTNAKQVLPWIICKSMKIIRVLPDEEVADICAKHGVVAQPVEA